jgi:hypothetical protein
MPIHLITSFYLPKNLKRQLEIRNCLKNNVECSLIECIHLYLDDNKAYSYLKKAYSSFIGSKIIIVSKGIQPKYSDLFSYANTLEGKQCMISNSDIWLHPSSNINIIKRANDKIIYSLTRYEYDMSKPEISNYRGSHDSFIFTSPLNNDIIKHVNHHQNILGSENVVLFELKKYGYDIQNPCFDIITVHEHKSEIRDYAGERMNRGGLDGDGVFKVRSHVVHPIVLNKK